MVTLRSMTGKLVLDGPKSRKLQGPHHVRSICIISYGFAEVEIVPSHASTVYSVLCTYWSISVHAEMIMLRTLFRDRHKPTRQAKTGQTDWGGGLSHGTFSIFPGDAQDTQAQVGTARTS